MKVYHGTLKRNAEEILSSNEIKRTELNNTQYPNTGYSKTTYGYVYLTKTINEALGFALLATKSKTCKQEVAIFELDICEDELEIDFDEKKHNACVTAINTPENSCVRIKRDLSLGADVKKYCFLDFENYQKGCQYADDDELGEKIKLRWIELKLEEHL